MNQIIRDFASAIATKDIVTSLHLADKLDSMLNPQNAQHAGSDSFQYYFEYGEFKIYAIKALRSITDMGLVEAKKEIESKHITLTADKYIAFIKYYYQMVIDHYKKPMESALSGKF